MKTSRPPKPSDSTSHGVLRRDLPEECPSRSPAPEVDLCTPPPPVPSVVKAFPSQNPVWTGWESRHEDGINGKGRKHDEEFRKAGHPRGGRCVYDRCGMRQEEGCRQGTAARSEERWVG